MDVLAYIVVATAAYLLGSIPTGYLVARARGIDIRAAGSGNIGATNVFRILGKPAGTFVLIVDGLKGFAAAAWLCDVLLKIFNVTNTDAEAYRIIAGICAVLGHNYTCWLKFKGGKGVATSAGVYFALAPLAAGIALGAWVIFFALSRYVSVASIASAVALPAAVWVTKDSVILGIVTTAIGLLAIVKHRENIKRLLNGTEQRFGKKTQAVPSANRTLSGLKTFGAFLLILGLAMVGYFFLAFDSSVGSGSGRVVNLGLMADRQNGILVGIGLGVIGTIMLAIGSRNQN